MLNVFLEKQRVSVNRSCSRLLTFALHKTLQEEVRFVLHFTETCMYI